MRRYRTKSRWRMKSMTKVDELTQRARNICEEAVARGDKVYGMKPWYCSVDIVEDGARIAFIGANPGGGRQEWDEDVESGGTCAPYDKGLQYNAWLDDEHSGVGQVGLQNRVKETFHILFGEKGKDILREAACFNVVPLRSQNVEKLSKETWRAGSDWCLNVVEHVSPEVIVCLGNGQRSAWNMFAKIGISECGREKVYNNFYIKRGYVPVGELGSSLVIGLPHLSRVKKMKALRIAAEKLKVCPILLT